MANKNEKRKNLKFNLEKPEQRKACLFLSKIEREQTAFVSYLVNQFIEEHKINDVDEMWNEDALTLVKQSMKKREGKVSVEAKPSLQNEDDMKRLIEGCIYDVLKKAIPVTALDETPLKEDKKTKRSVTDYKQETEDAKENTFSDDFSEVELSDYNEDEDEGEVNQDLFDALGSFY